MRYYYHQSELPDLTSFQLLVYVFVMTQAISFLTLTLLQNDFGPKLNQYNGGYFAYQQTDDEVKVWFWKRYTAGTPLDILDSHRKVVDPSKWGTPVAHFTSSNSCNLKEKLKPMKIVMNLTFCGMCIL